MKPWFQSLGLFVALGVFGVGSATAASEWDGGGGDSSLVTADNWNPNTAPSFGAATDLVFGALPGVAQSVQVNASFDAQHLIFSGATRPAYTFSGSATPTLTLHGNITVTDGSSNGVSFLSSLGLTLVGGAHTIHLNAANDHLTLGSWINETGGPASLTKTGSGTLWLSGDNTYSGGTVIEAGSVVVENATGSATGTGAVTVQSGATLQIGVGVAGIGGTSGQVSGAIVNDGAVVYARSNAVSAANISGTGSVNHSGSGTLTFTGTSNTYSGGTYIYENGTVVDANAGALPSSGGIGMYGGTLNVEFDETIKGLGDLVVDDVRLGGTVNLASTATLTIAGGGSDFSGEIRGLGKLVIGPGAVQQLKGLLSDFSGGTTIAGGTLEIAGDESLGDAAGGLVFNNGTLRMLSSWTSARAITLDGAGTIKTNTYEATLTGTLSGAGAFTFEGTGVLELTGNNGGLTGGINVVNGTLDFSTSANLGDANNIITLNGGFLRTTGHVADFTHPIVLGAGGGSLITEAYHSTLTGLISGGGTLAVRGGTAGGGSITLANSGNTYTGATLIEGDGENEPGTLRIGTDSNLGAAPSTPEDGIGHLSLNGGTLVATESFTLHPNRGIAIGESDGTLQVEPGVSLTYRGDIHGAGGLSKAGAGNLILGGDIGGRSTFAGGLAVEEGTLTLGRSSYNQIANPDVFESSPVGAGVLTLKGGTTLAATPESDGLNDGILLFNDVFLGSNESHTVTIDTTLDGLTLAGDIIGDVGIGIRKTGTGTLTLGGEGNTFDGGLALAKGTLRLVSSENTWSSPVGCGTLTLGRATTLQLPANTSLGVANPVKLDEIDATGAAGATIEIGDQSQLVLDGVISDGPGAMTPLSLTKAGAGTLTLGGDNSFAGGLKVESGQITLKSSSFIPVATIIGPVGSGALTMADQTKLRADSEGAIDLHNDILLGGEVGFVGSSGLTLHGNLADASLATGIARISGSVEFKDTTNSYTGATIIEQGMLTIAADGSLGAVPSVATAGHLKLNDGTLAVTGDMMLAATRGIDIGPVGGRISIPGATTLTYGGTITNSSTAAELEKDGAGTLVLSGTGSHPGLLVVADGKVQIVTAGALRSDTDVVVGDDESEPAVLLEIAANQEIRGFAGSGTTHIADGATFTVNLPQISADPLELFTSTYEGTLTGGSTAAFVKTGPGILNLDSASDSYEGWITAQSGVLIVNDAGALGTTLSGTTVQPGATLVLNNVTLGAEPLSLGGTGATGTVGALVSTGTASHSGAITLVADTTVAVSGSTDTLTFSGNIGQDASARRLVKTGSGTLVLAGTNNYTGWTKVDAGTLRATATGSLPSTTALGMGTATKLYIDDSQTISRFLGDIATQVEIAIGSAETFTVAPTTEALSLGNAGTYRGVLSGAGAFELAGVSGSLLFLEGNLTYTGGTSIAAGNTLKIAGAAGDTGALSHAITTNGVLAFYRNGDAPDLTVSGAITGSGKVMSYSAFTKLSNSGNTYSGGTEINGGVLAASAHGAFGASAITVHSGGTVALMNGASVNNTVNLDSGSTIAGSGTFESHVTIGSGVTLKPEGNDEHTVGTLAFNELTLDAGGIYEWNLLSPSAYDQVHITQPTTLNIGFTSGQFTLKLVSLGASGSPGTATGFLGDSTYTFTLFQSETINGYAPSKFLIDDTSFLTDAGRGTFSLLPDVSGSIQLQYITPVPEPSTWALLITGLAVVGAGAWRRQQRQRR